MTKKHPSILVIFMAPNNYNKSDYVIKRGDFTAKIYIILVCLNE